MPPLPQLPQLPNVKFAVLACTLAFGVGVAQPAVASAEAFWGVHVGGGIEGGTITKLARPDGIVEAGIIAEYLLPKRAWGVAATVEQVARQTTGYHQKQEIKADLLVRFATANHKFRFGFGAGLRWASQDVDQIQPRTLRGLDILRFDMSHTIVAWHPAVSAAPTLALDGYFSWTIGCYGRDARTDGDVMLTPAVGCRDTITNAYVVGIRTTAAWR